MASDFGTGTAITCSGNATLATWVAATEVTNIEFVDLWTRESVDFTHMESTTARAFKPTDLYDPGTMNVTVQFDETLVMLPVATETINRQLKSGIGDEDLASLVVAMRAEGRLTVPDDQRRDLQPRLICSLGLVQE